MCAEAPRHTRLSSRDGQRGTERIQGHALASFRRQTWRRAPAIRLPQGLLR